MRRDKKGSGEVKGGLFFFWFCCLGGMAWQACVEWLFVLDWYFSFFRLLLH